MSELMWFCSGANRVPDIEGLDRAGQAMGCCALEVSAAAEQSLAAADVPLFVDSGAFSEVQIDRGLVQVVRPIEDDGWCRILELAMRLVRARQRRTLVVAPDRVGDQEVTLERVRRWAPHLRDLERAGAAIVLPVQRGEMALWQMAVAVQGTAGLERPVIGIPGNKAAAHPSELVALARAARPVALHLLGAGPRRPSARALVGAARRAGFGGDISCDSNGLVAAVGRRNGPRGRPRPITAAQHLERELAAMRAHRGRSGPDYTDLVADVDVWLTGRARMAVVHELLVIGYDPPMAHAPEGELAAWLDERAGDPFVEHVVDTAWSRWYVHEERGECRARAVEHVFSTRPAQLELWGGGA